MSHLFYYALQEIFPVVRLRKIRSDLGLQTSLGLGRLGRSRNFNCIGNVAPTRREEMFRFDAEVEVFLDIDEETDDEVSPATSKRVNMVEDIFEHGWS